MSPSHCQETISLYMNYKNWLTTLARRNDDLAYAANILLKSGFKGFQTNRFGRSGSLSQTYVDHEPLLHQFFEQWVDEQSNKLHLACLAYLSSSWSLTCCRVAASFNSVLIVPMTEMLGIDLKKKIGHNWSDVKEFLQMKLKMLEELSEDFPGMKPEDKLIAMAAKAIKSAIDHQLNYVFL